MSTFEYVKNPSLKSLHPSYPGNKKKGRRYYNDERRVQPGFKDIMRFMLSGNPQRREKKRDPFRLPLLKNNEFIDDTRDMLVWLGHASFLIRLGGTTILIDPCLTNIPFVPRRVGIPCPIEELTGIDYILLSHGHRDHLDDPTLKKLSRVNPGCSFLTGLGVGSLLQKYRLKEIQEAGWYQCYQLPRDDLEIAYLPAIHWNRRGVTDFNLMLWGGFLIRTPSLTLYFSGDSAYGPHFQEIKQIVGQMDICMMPIGAYKPDYIMNSSHMSPEQSVEVFHEIKGSTFVPMHYGTYDLSNEPHGEPIAKMRQMVSDGVLQGELKELAVGEMMHLDEGGLGH